MRTSTMTLLILSAIAFAGCERGAAVTPATADTSPQPAESAEVLPVALPEGFSLGFAYRYAGQETARAGKSQRQRITLEFLEGDANSTVGSLAQSALAAGFSKGLWGVQKDGSIHFVADKAGFGQLRAVVRPAGAEAMRDPAAKGTVALGWPRRAAGAPKPKLDPDAG